MRLRLVKFAEVRGEALTRSYNDKTHELDYMPEQRAIRIRARRPGEPCWYADQAGAEWHPFVEDPAKDANGGPATAAPRQPSPVAQRPKR